jgi:hydroxyacylglutathione hydrolase
MVERVIVGPWKTNCYIYSSTKKECIIIDPGGDEEEIATRVDVLNMVPVGIALTHGHVDHVAALGRLCASYAARGYKLPVAINPADRQFLGSGGIDSHRRSLEEAGLDGLAFFAEDDVELPKADVRLRDGDHVFGMELVVLETPGHTPGGCCFYAEKEGILFSGDTLFFDGVGRTDLPGGSEKKLKESIQKKIAVLPPETRVFAGHGPFTTIERERRGNPFFRVPVETRPAAARPTATVAGIVGALTAAGIKAGPAVLAAAAKAAAVPRKPAPKAARKAVRKAARPGAPRPGSSRPGSSRPAPGPARKKPAPARPASRAAKGRSVPKKAARSVARPAGPASAKKPKVKVKGKAAAPGKSFPRERKRPQAARSTKAPGSGRRPAR